MNKKWTESGSIQLDSKSQRHLVSFERLDSERQAPGMPWRTFVFLHLCSSLICPVASLRLLVPLTLETRNLNWGPRKEEKKRRNWVSGWAGSRILNRTGIIQITVGEADHVAVLNPFWTRPISTTAENETSRLVCLVGAWPFLNQSNAMWKLNGEKSRWMRWLFYLSGWANVPGKNTWRGRLQC